MHRKCLHSDTYPSTHGLRPCVGRDRARQRGGTAACRSATASPPAATNSSSWNHSISSALNVAFSDFSALPSAATIHAIPKVPLLQVIFKVTIAFGFVAHESSVAEDGPHASACASCTAGVRFVSPRPELSLGSLYVVPGAPEKSADALFREFRFCLHTSKRSAVRRWGRCGLLRGCGWRAP